MFSYTSNIKELPAYKELLKQFNERGYTRGIEQWKSRSVEEGTAGYYINEIKYGRMGIEDIPIIYYRRSFSILLPGAIKKFTTTLANTPTSSIDSFGRTPPRPTIIISNLKIITSSILCQTSI